MSIHLHPDELIFHKIGDEIISAGFGINSILLKRGLPPMLSFSNSYDDDKSSSSSSSGESSSDESDTDEEKSIFHSFKNLAIPFGLMTTDKYKQRKDDASQHKGVVPDTLYDNLLKLATTAQPNKKRSAKNRIHSRNNKSARKRNKE